jgi:IS5 family transposase
VRFLLTPGQAHDLTGADALLPQMAAEVLIADKAYDADERVLKPSRVPENPPSSRLANTEQRPDRSTRRSTRHAT